MHTDSKKHDTPTDANNVLCTVPSRKEFILKYLKKKTPDYRFTWQKTQKWVAVYETVNTLAKNTGIPKSSIYKALKQLKGMEGFSFSHRLVSYEYRVE